MIKLIIGGIGSGKSITAVKEILKSKNMVFTNFDVKSKNIVRLRTDHIIKDEVVRVDKNGKDITKKSINWEFWKDLQKKNIQFDIFIDEIHNILHSRRSMTKWNTLFSIWLSQIRKLLGSSEINHLYLISQRVGAIDVSARDLANEIIYCSKRKNLFCKIPTTVLEFGRKREKMIEETWIFNFVFKGAYCLQKFENYQEGIGKQDVKSFFLANPFFKYYNSYELIEFGQEVYV